MRYTVSEISLRADEYADESRRSDTIRARVEKKIEKALRGAGMWQGRMPKIDDPTIVRESVDARKKPDVRAVFTIAFDSEAGLPLPVYEKREYDPARDLPHMDGTGRRPVIAGFGPAGIFAALVLSIAGARPIVIERGKAMESRIEDVERSWRGGYLDPESNVQFGEGGAGTFSDGKLTTGLRDDRIGWILRSFEEAGADPSITYRKKPHIGTDRLRLIIPEIRKKIITLGGEVRFSTRLEGIEHEDGRLVSVKTTGGRIETECLILATGHSAEDTFRMLLREGVDMKQKPFSIGLRIEHLQEDINRAQYAEADLADIFGPAEYKLNHRCENGRGVYTFCMCPGGRVINASSSEGYSVTNGMSDMARDGRFANSGLLVDVRTDDFRDEHPLAGIEFQKRYEKLACEAARRQIEDKEGGEASTATSLPVSTYGHFRDHEEDLLRSCLPGFAVESIIEAMPHLGKKLKGFDSDEARLTAVETRSSSPVRIFRDDAMNSTIKGIIPAGEGPGYAGGIISAALDGVRAAEAVLDRYMIER